MRRAAKLGCLLAFGVLVCLPSVARADYVIGGSPVDWGINLQTSGGSFIQSSFTPSPLGTIDYNVEDWDESDDRPIGGEQYDLEAVYFDDTAENFYFALVTSLPWNASIETEIEIIANGYTHAVSDPASSPFTVAWSNLNKWDNGLTNYFLEGSIPASEFGNPDAGTYVTLNVTEECGNDCISLRATIDNGPSPGPSPIPEPATLSLMGLALLGLVMRRKKA